ncbi:uncharacterized protein LOC111271336 [Varroa jacobsoni]|uniref:Uncharacterized protein n=1 Tax=Varroa destructor TaxID=109461 RepID=A0A7M7K3B2_VARDE|nr:uncharacterized protein LOC111247813 [Varroa destructor]XP_022654970.1 uncharacterized protein LOC111247813 [Varroa destructor]XP_022654971.1 uncharacterized protein LOC111247813 [Varroa destructor]XP_022707802.1 uncharacterized protein LOC111271336 [Varroa jacobsoni]XP_022707803.1 uncharacterized protein LOC111271336 [Varroa jacobsoni]XP_022707804.1 uncharacterized protein LOC111271336 [Varroa jacobsoni]
MMERPRVLRPGEKLPPNCRLLLGDELDTFLNKAIAEYKPSKDMIPLKYAAIPMGLTAGVCAFAVTTTFRRFFKLGSFAQKTCYAAVIFPASTTSVIMHSNTTKDIIHRETKCPVCVQTRAMSFQALFGALYPAIVAPIICASFSVPRALAPSFLLKENVIAILRHMQKKPKVYIWSILANAVVGGVWTHLEQNASWKLHVKLSGEHPAEKKKKQQNSGVIMSQDNGTSFTA